VARIWNVPKLFIMIGTAEDHHSNPMKIALAQFKRNGGKFIAINPVRSGYAGIADEWVPIKPGTTVPCFWPLLMKSSNRACLTAIF